MALEKEELSMRTYLTQTGSSLKVGEVNKRLELAGFLKTVETKSGNYKVLTQKAFEYGRNVPTGNTKLRPVYKNAQAIERLLDRISI